MPPMVATRESNDANTTVAYEGVPVVRTSESPSHLQRPKQRQEEESLPDPRRSRDEFSETRRAWTVLLALWAVLSSALLGYASYRDAMAVRTRSRTTAANDDRPRTLVPRNSAPAISGGLAVLTSETFDDFLLRPKGETRGDGFKSSFVLFHADWCVFSRRLLPAWSDFAKTVEATPSLAADAQVGVVDCVADPALCRRDRIAAFPTMRWFRGGNSDAAIDFHEDRTVENLVAFASRMLRDPSTELEFVRRVYSAPQAQAHLDRETTPWPEAYAPGNYVDSESADDDWVSEDDDWESKEEEEEEEYGEEEEAADPEAKVVAATDLTDQTFKNFLREHPAGSFVSFGAPWCVWCQKLKPAFDRLAREVREDPSLSDVVGIGAVDCVAQADLCRERRIMVFPTLLWHGPNGETSSPSYRMDRTVEAMMSYVRGKAQQTSLDGDLPETKKTKTTQAKKKTKMTTTETKATGDNDNNARKRRHVPAESDGNGGLNTPAVFTLEYSAGADTVKEEQQGHRDQELPKHEAGDEDEAQQEDDQEDREMDVDDFVDASSGWGEDEDSSSSVEDVDNSFDDEGDRPRDSQDATPADQKEQGEGEDESPKMVEASPTATDAVRFQGLVDKPLQS